MHKRLMAIHEKREQKGLTRRGLSIRARGIKMAHLSWLEKTVDKIERRSATDVNNVLRTVISNFSLVARRM